jgi:transposase-like protein
MAEPKTLLEAIQHFSDEQTCIDAVARMRWPDGPHCPDCEGKQGEKPYYLRLQRRWKCRYCRRQFSVKVGTIFEDSPISLCKWLPALWLLVSCKNGVSSWEIHRALGVSQKSAWFMLHRLRLALQEGFGMLLSDGGPIEVDETFIGGHRVHSVAVQMGDVLMAGKQPSPEQVAAWDAARAQTTQELTEVSAALEAMNQVIAPTQMDS